MGCKSGLVADEAEYALGISEDAYWEAVDASLLNKGNNYLMKSFLKKLDNDQDVYIACIGGSVTEGAGPASYGEGYAYQFYNALKNYYAKDAEKVHFVGAGLSGTPSPLGLVRYQKDVVDVLGRNPDLLVIEFSVNDYQECSKTRAFEYLIRNALENNTAVIALYAAATYGNQQYSMTPVAQFYKIQEVSVLDGLKDSGVNQTANSKVYYTDTVHPTSEGHGFMADCLLYLLDTIAEDPEDKPVKIPDGYKNANPFTNFTAYFGNSKNSKVVIDAGDFNQKDSQIQGYSKGGKSFPENWKKGSSKSEKNFTMFLECKNLMIVYKNSNSKTFGKAEVLVDGKVVKTLDGGKSGGWNNCVIDSVIDNKTCARHIVEVRMAKGDEEKSFTILAFGYVK